MLIKYFTVRTYVLYIVLREEILAGVVQLVQWLATDNAIWFQAVVEVYRLRQHTRTYCGAKTPQQTHIMDRFPITSIRQAGYCAAQSEGIKNAWSFPSIIQ